jgi:hypothetical protein
MIALADNAKGLADTGGGVAVAEQPGRICRLASGPSAGSLTGQGGRLDVGLMHESQALKKRAHAREAAAADASVQAPDPARAGGRPVLAEDRKAILAALCEGYTMRTAARRGGVSQRTLYARLGQDADFAAQVAEARRFGRERREDELAEKLFQNAEKAATDPRYQTSLFWALANLDPEHWKLRPR